MRIHIAVFSPTGTSLRTARAVAEGFGPGHETVLHDLTHDNPDDSGVRLAPDDAVIAAVPVYGGHVPAVAAERLRRLSGDSTPAIAIVVYGNRAYEKALGELSALLRERGFRIVGAGTFIGEHSYSTAAHPIAPSRPDAADIERASAFGAGICLKLAAGDLRDIDVRRISGPRQPLFGLLKFIWRVIRLRRSGRAMPACPTTDASACSACGTCAGLCPTKAISEDGAATDPAKCIRCCACVKGCPAGARKFDTPFAEILSECFPERKEPATIL